MIRRLFPISAIPLLFAASLAAQLLASPQPFSTFLKAHSSIQQVATDAQGFIYVFGEIYPDTVGYSQRVYVARLDPAATTLTYLVTLGGSSSVFAPMTRAVGLAVDSAGNAYVTGYTNATNFPTVPLAATNTSGNALLPYVAKINPIGGIVYSTLFSNGVQAIPQAIAITAGGEAVVSGINSAAGFPTTPGAYNNVAYTAFPFTTKLDTSGTKIVFSLVGAGGSRLAIDGSDNVFMAGTTQVSFGNSTPYPTTPGAFQTTYTPYSYCDFLCQLGPTNAGQQYVTKLSADGSKLIYSTFVTGSRGANNAGMAIDANGNVWLTGDTSSPDYPYTQTQNGTASQLFTTELDPTGSRILLSVPVGVPPGDVNNLAIDPQGNLVAAGIFPIPANPLTQPANSQAAPTPPAETRPWQCLADSAAGVYVLRISVRDGGVLQTRILPDRAMAISSAVDSQGNVYIGGFTLLPNTALTPGVYYDTAVAGRTSDGAFLKRLKLSVPASPIGCVTDSTSMSLLGPVAPGQLVTLYGSAIGPVEPAIGLVGGEASVSTSIGAVSVTFDGRPAPILYASSTQINVQAPFEIKGNAYTVMQLSFNGAVIGTRSFAVTPQSPSLFVISHENGLIGFALNEDGSLNSSDNPAAAGSKFTVFVNGLGTAASNRVTGSLTGSNPGLVFGPAALLTGYSLEVESFTDQPGAISGVGQITARVPKTILWPQQMGLTLSLQGTDAGPMERTALGSSARPLPVIVFVKP